MIELLFVACLSSQPAMCEERSLVFVDVTPAMCLQGAQPELAKWIGTHPDHVIARWRCREVTPSERDA